MTQTLSGGCVCGGIRFQCNADPLTMVNCHCRDCQRVNGAAYAAVVVVPKSEVQLRGDPRYDGKGVQRGFCQTCGSQLTMKWERLPDIFGLQAGCLDDPSLHKPMMDLFTASAQPWDYLDPSVQKHAQGPQKFP